MRLNRQQQQHILQAMLDEARKCARQRMSGPETVKAIRQVKQDMLAAYRAGIEIIPTPDQEPPARHE